MRLQSVPLFSPALFLLIALAIIGLTLASRRPRTPMMTAAFYLAFSAALYFLSFLLVGVANMYRYQFYPLAAAAIALVLFLSDRIARKERINRAEWACIAAALLLLIAIWISRAVL
jgi:FtsH-binding integral membrane protein